MKQIYLSEHGILPNTDISGQVNALLKQNPLDTAFHFSPGVYHLYPQSAAPFFVSLSNSDLLPVLKAGLLLSNMRNIKICGHGATLLCHGQLSPLALLDSRHISIDGLTIDYSPSHNGEGIIMQSTPEWTDVAVDKEKYPYKIETEHLFFWNGEEYTPYFGAIEFDAVTRRTAYLTGDKFRSKRQEEVSEGVIRFHGKFDPLPTVGNIVTLRYSPRIHPGILTHHCEDITLDNITLHNTCGLGVLTQFSRDLHYSRIAMRPNESAGRRVVSCHDDGLHFSNNSGKITVDGCCFHGLMDDPINVHGTALRIREITGPGSLIAEFAHDQSIAFPLWAKPHDEVSLIEHNAMNSLGSLKVEKYCLLSDNTCELSFAGDLPSLLKPGDALENLNNTPEVDIRNCYFGSCRARGILVSTPRKVVIENNVFESSGCAILIPGDANYWFESGACKDVTIHKNHFTDGCMISMYQFCEGVISICPVIPAPQMDKPFHENIRIEENTFHVFDAPVLYALSVQGLTFQNNTVIRSFAYKPWHPRHAMATLKACTDVQIADNRFVGDVLSTEVVKEAL
jgi:hypothetical protein